MNLMAPPSQQLLRECHPTLKFQLPISIFILPAEDWEPVAEHDRTLRQIKSPFSVAFVWVRVKVDLSRCRWEIANGLSGRKSCRQIRFRSMRLKTSLAMRPSLVLVQDMPTWLECKNMILMTRDLFLSAQVHARLPHVSH